jgi:hypothetical protein
MLSRGYDGELRSMRRDALPRRDLLWGVGCATVLLVVMLQALLSV